MRRAEKLIAAGWLTHRIARRLGIGERTVRVIKAGTHHTQLARDVEELGRCPGCGALLTVSPCILCEMRKAGL